MSDEQKRVALDAVLKAHVEKACEQGFSPNGPLTWTQGSPQRECAQYLADNPDELARIRAEIVAEREPQHAFPDDDDDLEGEMYEDDDGEVMTVATRSHHKPETFYCIGDKGAWDWPTASKIRACKPLGPSPRKRLEQARKRVCEAAADAMDPELLDGGESRAALRQALADLEALEASE